MAADNGTMLRLAVIVMLAVFSCACSRIEIAYRNADLLLEYYAWKIVRINELQREHWQPVLQSTLQRHREEELPLVFAYLDLAGHIVRETDNTLGARCLVDGALYLYKRHKRLAVDLVIPLLVDLDTAQIKHLAEYMTQDYQDDLKLYLNPDLRQRKKSREKRFVDNIEDWTGKLNDNQRKQVRDAVDRIPDMSESWLAYRVQQMDTLLALLESGTNTESLQKYFNEWWINRDRRPAGDRKLWRIAKNEFIQLMDDLATTLSSKQRTRLVDRLDDYRSDLAPFLPTLQSPANLKAVPACVSAPV